jgi:recombination protein RecA
MSANALRARINAALADRIPSALSPASRVIRPVAPTGVAEIDQLLDGGLPLGAITEMLGPESSGRTSVALSFVARTTQAGRVCAWVDVSEMLQPESAAATGIDLSRLLWIRCGVQKGTAAHAARSQFVLPEKYLIQPPEKKGLHGGGCGGHPRNEVKGMSSAVGEFFHQGTIAPRCAEPQRRVRREREVFAENVQPMGTRLGHRSRRPAKPWSRIEQALRATDLLLQAGGFSAIVLDMASIAPEYASRVPLATWFRYRAAAERTQASFILLTQHPCATSSVELQLRFHAGNARNDESTVFTGIEHRVEVVRWRFGQPPTHSQTNVVPLRKPPQSVNAASWQSRTTWAGPR